MCLQIHQSPVRSNVISSRLTPFPWLKTYILIQSFQPTAYRASQYLQTLLDSGAIVPEASKALDTVYKDYAPQPPPSQPHSPSSPSSPSPSPSPPPPHETNLEKEQPQPQHTLLLTRHAVPAILALFKLKEGAAADMYRAAEQARVRVRSGRGEL